MNACKDVFERFLKFSLYYNLQLYLGFLYLCYIIKYYYLNKSLLTIHQDCFSGNKSATCIYQKPLSISNNFLSAHILLKFNFLMDINMNFTKSDSNVLLLTPDAFPRSGQNDFVLDVSSFQSDSYRLFNTYPDAGIKFLLKIHFSMLN